MGRINSVIGEAGHRPREQQQNTRWLLNLPPEGGLEGGAGWILRGNIMP